MTPCKPWHGNINRDGYGRVKIAGRTWLAHVWVYEREIGPVPEGMELDHTCRNKACVNTDHLEPVTHAENVRRAAPKLTHELAEQIRNSTGSCRSVGLQFGISKSMVSMVRTGKCWA